MDLNLKTLTRLDRAGGCPAGVRIGQAMIGALFLISGALKAIGFAALAARLSQMGLPLAPVLTTLVIIVEAGCGAALFLAWQTRLAAATLAAFVVPATFLFHAFWAADAASYGNQLNHFLKNVGLFGALLAIACTRPSADRSACTAQVSQPEGSRS
ncbi:DoxX family protein [Cupriavidus pauculus]|nr:DoxX family protein [Cupriavidus pauculus]